MSKQFCIDTKLKYYEMWKDINNVLEEEKNTDIKIKFSPRWKHGCPISVT